jgi:hypothetical protein
LNQSKYKTMDSIVCLICQSPWRRLIITNTDRHLVCYFPRLLSLPILISIVVMISRLNGKWWLSTFISLKPFQEIIILFFFFIAWNDNRYIVYSLKPQTHISKYFQLSFIKQCISSLKCWWLVIKTLSKVVSSNPAQARCTRYNIMWYKFDNELRQFGGYLRVLRFPPPIKLTAMI